MSGHFNSNRALDDFGEIAYREEQVWPENVLECWLLVRMKTRHNQHTNRQTPHSMANNHRRLQPSQFYFIAIMRRDVCFCLQLIGFKYTIPKLCFLWTFVEFCWTLPRKIIVCSTFWKHAYISQYRKTLIQVSFHHGGKSSRYRWATCRRWLQPRKWSEFHLDQCQYYPVLCSARTRTKIPISLSRSARGFVHHFCYQFAPRSKFSDRMIEILWFEKGKEWSPIQPTSPCETEEQNQKQQQQKEMSFASENWSHNLFRAQFKQLYNYFEPVTQPDPFSK